MLPVSDFAKVALLSSFRVDANVDFRLGGAPVALNVPIVDGSVSADVGSSPMRTGSFTIAGDPATMTDVNPWGLEATPRVGLRLPDGTWEYWELGVFRVNGVTSSRPGYTEVSISDRSAGVADDRFLAPTTISGTVHNLTNVLVHDVYPGVTVTIEPGIDRPLAAVTYEESRWDCILASAQAIGAWAYFDTAGNVQIKKVPSKSATDVWTLTDGVNGTIVEAPLASDREGVYNAVVASGESTDEAIPPVSDIAYDNNAGSRTRWGGPFGKVPRFYSSPLLATKSQAKAAATSILATSVTRYETTDITAVPCWALEPGDPVRVISRGRDVHTFIDGLNLPLGIGTMTVKPRAQIALDNA